MGRHKYRSSFRKRENDIAQNGEGLLDAVSAFAKNLTKKAAKSAAKSATVKLSEKAGRKLGESAAESVADNFFRKTSRQNPVRSTKITSGLSEARVEDLYQSPENSGDEIFKILSSAAKAQPKVKQKVQPKAQPKQILQKDSEVHRTNNQRPKPMRDLTQQEINKNLNRLMNM